MQNEQNLGKEILYYIILVEFSDESFGPGAVIRTGCAVRTMPPCFIYVHKIKNVKISTRFGWNFTHLKYTQSY